jgi:tryptophan-rich sensory protein
MHWIVILVGSVLIIGLLGAAICLTIETWRIEQRAALWLTMSPEEDEP